MKKINTASFRVSEIYKCKFHVTADINNYINLNSVYKAEDKLYNDDVRINWSHNTENEYVSVHILERFNQRYSGARVTCESLLLLKFRK